MLGCTSQVGSTCLKTESGLHQNLFRTYYVTDTIMHQNRYITSFITVCYCYIHARYRESDVLPPSRHESALSPCAATTFIATHRPRERSAPIRERGGAELNSMPTGWPGRTSGGHSTTTKCAAGERTHARSESSAPAVRPGARWGAWVGGRTSGARARRLARARGAPAQRSAAATMAAASGLVARAKPSTSITSAGARSNASSRKGRT